MEMAAPPPPARRRRQPFITSFLENVLPFLPARELLVCATVSRTWREESRALSIWRALLISNPRTVQYGYQGLTLGEMQKIALRAANLSDNRGDAGGVTDQETSGMERSDLRDSERRAEPSLENARGNQRRQFSSCGGVSTLERGAIMIQRTGGAICVETKSCTNDIQKTFETVQTYIVHVRENVKSIACVIDALRQKVPSSESIKFHQQCVGLWKRLNVFEEIVIDSLDEGETASLRGLRNFKQVEVVMSGQVESQAYIQWCFFKQALPLDETYYDYVDLLYSLGPARCSPAIATLSEIELAVERIRMNNQLQTVIDGVIMMKSVDIGRLCWESLMAYVNTERRAADLGGRRPE
ncbi:uncharacterized protein TEOVI_000624600 [Trypanosoma equiperdum]|uniref:F-box domain-containing protein n=1 Tax=Trypanosoma equiperdum TaxID=5694 RepID=A0A1G4I2T8_TRYEQ|nr:hypothetical protein, conserved [Trypanosoma equiperdum]